MFDFDRVIDRRGTHASKWDLMAKLSGITAADGIPMWVADMDFAAPPGVTEALNATVTRAVHGYYADTGSWSAALAEWMLHRHGLPIDPATRSWCFRRPITRSGRSSSPTSGAFSTRNWFSARAAT
jgi:cysteine-S-conjugate beta-lyase